MRSPGLFWEGIRHKRVIVSGRMSTGIGRESRRSDPSLARLQSLDRDLLTLVDSFRVARHTQATAKIDDLSIARLQVARAPSLGLAVKLRRQ